MKHRSYREKGEASLVHPNTLRLLEAMRRIRFGRITEITVADGVPLKFRVEQLVDLSKDEESLLAPYGCEDRLIQRDRQ